MNKGTTKPNSQGILESSTGKTMYFADEESGITTDGKRFYCPERDELRKWKEKAIPHLESMLWTYSDRLAEMSEEMLLLVDPKSLEKTHRELTELVNGDQ